MTAQIDEAYGQGWHDAQQAIGQRLLSLISEATPPRPAVWQRRCQNCQEPLEIGQQAERAGQDVFGNSLFVHYECPVVVDRPTPEGEDQPTPALSLVKERPELTASDDMAQWGNQLLAAVQVQEDPPEPEPAAAAAPEMLLAVATGAIGGPFIITVSNPTEGTYQLAHIELMTWRGFSTLAAKRELENAGYRITDDALADRNTLNSDGWSQAAPYCWTAPVVAIEEDQELTVVHPDNYLAGLTMEPAPAQDQEPEHLPHREPAATFRVHPLATLTEGFQPILDYVTHDQGRVIYRVMNATCAADRGVLHMTMTYNHHNRLTGQSTACQTCGAEIEL